MSSFGTRGSRNESGSMILADYLLTGSFQRSILGTSTVPVRGMVARFPVSPMRAACRLIVVLLSASTLLSCGSSRDDRGTMKPEPTDLKRITPNTSRLVATVVSVDSLWRSTNQNDPCSRVPCRAIIRIDSVLGYGSVFNRPLAPGESLSVQFGFTLHPTRELFPDLKQRYGPLVVGSIIKAEVQESRVYDQQKDQQVYMIYGVDVR